MSAPPRVVNIAEYQISACGHPLVGMSDNVAAALQRSGLANREQVVAALATAADLAGTGPTVGSTRMLETVISLASRWAPLWLVFSVSAGGYIAEWPF